MSKIFVIVGPSGVGKTTLSDIIIDAIPNTRRAVSHTTRAPRENEHDGEDYHFVTPSEFMKLEEEGKFFAITEYYANRYATSIDEVERNEGESVLCIMDHKGFQDTKEAYPDLISIFIYPPHKDELVRRLEDRGMTPEQITLRLSQYHEEVVSASQYDYIVLNNKDITSAVISLAGIINELRHPLSSPSSTVRS